MDGKVFKVHPRLLLKLLCYNSSCCVTFFRSSREPRRYKIELLKKAKLTFVFMLVMMSIEVSLLFTQQTCNSIHYYPGGRTTDTSGAGQNELIKARFQRWLILAQCSVFFIFMVDYNMKHSRLSYDVVNSGPPLVLNKQRDHLMTLYRRGTACSISTTRTLNYYLWHSCSFFEFPGLLPPRRSYTFRA